MQCEERGLNFDRVVLAFSGGGTQAGLTAEARALGCKGRILGIGVDLQAGSLQGELADLATAVAEYLG